MLQRGGFTLLEVVLVAAMMAAIATFSVGVYRNYGKSVELDSISKNIIYDLRQMRVRAAGGEDRLNFGGHFVNGTDDYYELFSTPSDYSDPEKMIITAVNLPITINFSAPTEGVSKDILFNSISGDASVDFITISSEGSSKTVNVTASGAVY